MKSKKKSMSGGSYSDKARVTRSCTKLSSKPYKGNLNKCTCEETKDEFTYDKRFFECEESGFSLIDSSSVNPRFKKLVEKILEFDDTFQKYDSRTQYIKEVDDYINKEYKQLNLDLETKNFIREYILDDFKYRRRFKGEVGSKNFEILIKNLDKIKQKLLKQKQSNKEFTLVNLKTELKDIIRLLEIHISQVNVLISNDGLEKQIKGDPYNFSETKVDLKKILREVKTGERKLTKSDLREKIDLAFEQITKVSLQIVKTYTESKTISDTFKIKLRRKVGKGEDSKKEFCLKYSDNKEELNEFTVVFLNAVVDGDGADGYKQFADKKTLIKFISELVKYDSMFKKGAEKGVEKYFQSYTFTEIVDKIKSYTNLENFLIEERNVIQSVAGLQFTSDSLNSNSQSTSDVVNKIRNLLEQISESDAEKFNDMVKYDGGDKLFIKKNNVRNTNESIKNFITRFFRRIHENSDRRKRRIESLSKIM